MASACVNNNVRLLSETFFDTPTDWFNPRSSSDKPSSPAKQPEKDILDLDFSGDSAGDFEFHLDDDPVKMLPADELFSDGKLMPSLHLSTVRTSVASVTEEEGSGSSASFVAASVEEILKSKISSLSGMDPYLFSPKAPRCSSGWRELLGLKKLQNGAKHENKQDTKTSLKPSSSSLKHFMHRNPKFDPSLGMPLLKQTNSETTVSESVSASTNEIPRVSLESNNKSSLNSTKRNPHPHPHHPPRVRLVRRVPDSNQNSNNNNTSNHHHHHTPATPSSNSVSASASALGVSIDSPRMNSSGKVVFQSLERSSSSPSTFNGGPRVKYKGMERRSYSANVKVSPVLNVPVCSLRGSSKFGLGQLFPSPHKKAGGTTTTSTDSTERSRNHHNHTNKHKPLP